jgi:hypothetical protein
MKGLASVNNETDTPLYRRVPSEMLHKSTLDTPSIEFPTHRQINWMPIHICRNTEALDGIPISICEKLARWVRYRLNFVI